ncbi:MAG: ribosome-associated translation inhibitor RaiA [Ignavibacteria bacterium]|nr:MAG: ribosome-associated translation inhibitor RaiA [Ignavibacteria bacterium]
MNVQITSRKFKAKDSLKEYIHKELKSLEKYFDDIREANVVLYYTHQKDSIKTAEILLQVPGKSLVAEVSSDDFTKSVHGCVQKLERQLKDLKAKLKKKVKA